MVRARLPRLIAAALFYVLTVIGQVAGYAPEAAAGLTPETAASAGPPICSAGGQPGGEHGRTHHHQPCSTCPACHCAGLTAALGAEPPRLPAPRVHTAIAASMRPLEMRPSPARTGFYPTGPPVTG